MTLLLFLSKPYAFLCYAWAPNAMVGEAVLISILIFFLTHPFTLLF